MRCGTSSRNTRIWPPLVRTGHPNANSLTHSANEAVAKQPEAIGHGCSSVTASGRVGLHDGPPAGGSGLTFTVTHCPACWSPRFVCVELVDVYGLPDCHRFECPEAR